MKATKSVMLLLVLNKLRKRKILFCRKMKHFLLTFALFMQKQDYYYCSGYVSQVFQNPKTRRPRLYWMINKQRWFKKMIARKDKPVFQELWKKQPPEVFFKKRCSLEISQNSQENTCATASFLIKLQALPMHYWTF